MASISLFFHLLISSLLISRGMAATSADQSLIRTSCSHTRYPDLCYSSLSPYAASIGRDPVLLARYAMNVTISDLKPLSMYITSLLRHNAAKPSSSSDQNAALKDCSELISDAMDQVRKSEKEVAGLEGMVGSEVTWRIANAQTWLSAAITDEGTCTDGFEEGSGGTGTGEDVQKAVRRKVERVKQLTSNSLALVNSLQKS